MKPLSLWVACAALLTAGPFVTSAAAQAPGSPGQPRIVAHGDCTVTLSWNDAGGPSVFYSVLATLNGVFQASVPVGNRLDIRGRLPQDGDWLFVVRASNNLGSTDSPPVGYFHSCSGGTPPPAGPPTTAPTWISLNVAGSTVTASFTAVTGATQYELEGTVQATGQVLIVPLGPNVSFSVPACPQATSWCACEGVMRLVPAPGRRPGSSSWVWCFRPATYKSHLRGIPLPTWISI